MQKIFLILCLILSTSILNAGTIDPKKNDSLYLRLAEKYSCCLRLHSLGKHSNQSVSTGSCVLVRPNIVLTAAHIMELHKDCNFCIYDNGKMIKIKKIYVPKKFNLNKISYYDIAVCVLDSPASPKPCEISYAKPRPNTQVTIAGFGMLGNFDTGAQKLNDNRLRAGFNRIDGYQNQCMILSAKRNSYMTSAEYLIVGGDSGGGVFLDNKLVAINSYISAKNSRHPNGMWNEESGHTCLYFVHDWINTILD